MVMELSPAQEEGFYNVNERMRRSINTTIISGVAETGMFQHDAIEETAKAVKELYDAITGSQGVKREDLFIVGSSALFKVKNRDELAKRVKELTGKEMYFVDKEGEVFYNIIGSIPSKYRTSALSIDIGSGNTKIGYLEGDSKRLVSIEIPYGTVSLTEAAKKEAPSDKAYVSALLKLTGKDISTKLRQESSRKPSLLNRKPIFMVGGIVWAMATILYPERQDSFVKLTSGDINKFYDSVVTKKEAVFNIDLSRIKDEEMKKKAEKQLQSLKDVFTIDNLIAGATLLKTIADELKFKDKEIYFARNGSWLWGYIAETGIEKIEGQGR